MNEHNAMTKFRAAVRAAVASALDQGLEFSDSEIIEPLLKKNRRLVVEALAVIVVEEIARLDDDRRTQKLMARRGCRVENMGPIQAVAKTLDVPVWLLLEPAASTVDAFRLADVIFRLRVEAMRMRLGLPEAPVAPVDDDSQGLGQGWRGPRGVRAARPTRTV